MTEQMRACYSVASLFVASRLLSFSLSLDCANQSVLRYPVYSTVQVPPDVDNADGDAWWEMHDASGCDMMMRSSTRKASGDLPPSRPRAKLDRRSRVLRYAYVLATV
jgi:hypothetical protein